MTDIETGTQKHQKTATEKILSYLIEKDGLSQVLRALQYCLEESADQHFSQRTPEAQAKAATLYKAADTLDAPFETIKLEYRL